MPGLRDSDPVALVVSDLHLWHEPPIARSEEPDWWACQRRQLSQLWKWRDEFRAPLLIAGDLFHKWNARPETISFALAELPDCFAIPGQHDLPFHRYEDIQQSAYWTLVQAGKVSNLDPTSPRNIELLTIHAFPWGFDVIPCPTPPSTFGVNLALIHAYIWNEGSGHEKATKTSHANTWDAKLGGYEAAAFGDNHTGFLLNAERRNEVSILNCGGFMRRTIAEKHASPCAGLLRFDGRWDRLFFDVKEDRLIDVRLEDAVKDFGKTPEELLEFLEELQGVENTRCDFEEAVKHFFDGHAINERIREIVWEAMRKK